MVCILITGASGLLGLNLALEASKRHRVFGVVNNHPLKTEKFTVLTADLLDPGAVERVVDQVQPDWVIHCAALANLESCEKDPALAQELNTELPRKLAAYVTRGGARLVHISTDAVFDGGKGDYTEDDQPNPLSIYARTKFAGEQAVAAANPGAIIARVNLYGWSLTGKRSLAEFFYNNLSAGTGIMGFTDVYFCPLLVNDLAQVLIKMLTLKLSGLYHVVSPDCLSKYAFGIALARRFGLDGNLITPTSVFDSGLQAARSPLLTLCIDKLIRDLGEIPPGISTGLERLYTLYQQNYPQAIRGMASNKV